MARTIDSPHGVARETAAPTAPETRKARPIVWFGVIGAGFVLLEAWIYITWFTTGEAHRTPTGSSPIPTSTHVWAAVFQISGVVLTVVAIVLAARQSIRQRRLSWDAMLVIAWVSLYWQDPLINYVRHVYLYSSVLWNWGSWVERIPGWRSPGGHLLPEPILFSGNAYFWLGPGASILAFFFMRRARRRWPQLGVIGTILCGLAGMVALDILAEVTFIRTGLYAYPGAIRSLSAWGGHRYQFPIYEAILWGSVWTTMGALRFFRDDRGRSVVERGVDRVAAPRWRTPLRVLALVGVANVAMLAYSVAINYTALFADPFPRGYPTWLLNRQCGQGTTYACSSPRIPIPLPGSDHLPPRPSDPD